MRLIHPLSNTIKSSPTSKRVWLFDLDNTLHDASHAVFSQIDKSMTTAVMQALQIDFEAATQLRQRYWERYGATMIGMQRHHGVNAIEFLKQSHDFDITAFVKPEPRLAYLLQQTLGVKYVLTNAPYHYAITVLEALHIKHCFKGICAIDQMCLNGQYRPKPSLQLMQALLKELNCPAHHITLVEDTLKNLKTAKYLGMQCAHIFNQYTPFSTAYDGRPSYVDIKVHSIQALLLSPFARQT
ncbi:pyrimidine 5'-nucleotidase [Pelistega sp. NLN82]|uniref:Pyrimidine 5'-nucleotidase n=1 Tax=Pelistega ratti TaxID=2652177 RepID=A0A6L9Y4Y4_9BURK|nr:pyrimidine 5'-nucleotidase [Pelistega ratti]NEN74864.1 pyrimidine 5'-nucleotidase [Pelistega ratti]